MKKVIALLFISLFVLPLVASCSVQAATSTPFHALGTVLDRYGKPVQGATVKLIDGNFNVIGTTTSDESGNFEFVNVISSTSDCIATITYTEGSNTYDIKITDTIWYMTDTGIIKFDTKYTTLFDYPAPEYGYFWGIMQQEGSQRSLGNGVVYASNGDQTYYVFTDNVKNKGTFLMRLPVGHYKVWGQYSESGMLFQSTLKPIDVEGSTNHLDVISTTITVPLNAPANAPTPSVMPTNDQLNVVSGYVTFKDGKPVTDQTVMLYQSTDDGMNTFNKVGEIRTDGNGFYQFYGVAVTADAPDNMPVYSSKKFNLTTLYTDAQGNSYLESKLITLYHPNFISEDSVADQRDRNPVVNFTIPYSTLGWVKISTVTADVNDARIHVDNKLITGSDGKPVTLPYTAYLEPGPHTIRVSAPGFEDWKAPVNIVENMQTEDMYVGLNKSALPSWVPLAATVVILIIVVLIIAALLFTKRQMFLGMLGGIMGPIQGAFGKSLNNMKASSQAKKAHRAQMAEVRKAEQAKMAQIREASIASQSKIDGKKKDHEKAFTAKAEQPRLPEYRGEEEDAPSMISARDIYQKQDRSSVERISQSHATKGPAAMAHDRAEARSEARAESRAPVTSEPDGRMRVPKTMPVSRDQPPATSIKDKEKVIRYIREHQDGVSFIQMSNDLEISPNTLTIITKELVINDDIEKIKGLYYYKSHDSSSDDSSSSVVVWRLDGEE